MIFDVLTMHRKVLEMWVWGRTYKELTWERGMKILAFSEIKKKSMGFLLIEALKM